MIHVAIHAVIYAVIYAVIHGVIHGVIYEVIHVAIHAVIYEEVHEVIHVAMPTVLHDAWRYATRRFPPARLLTCPLIHCSRQILDHPNQARCAGMIGTDQALTTNVDLFRYFLVGLRR